MGALGFGFNERTAPPSSEELAALARPYVETCIEAFGTSRSMFESNFPVDKASFSYQVFWNACKLLAKGASDTEKADLFAGSAARFYRIDPGRWRSRAPGTPSWGSRGNKYLNQLERPSHLWWRAARKSSKRVLDGEPNINSQSPCCPAHFIRHTEPLFAGFEPSSSTPTWIRTL